MPEIEITPSHVINAIKNLKNSVSRTPDKIPSLFVKRTATALSIPLSILFNLSLTLGKVPDSWTKAIVVPIYKKGLKSNPSNYRPISLTSIICRIFEYIIHKYISDHLLSNDILSSSQHGFLPSRSTLTQQLNLTNDLATLLDEKLNSNMIYLDFSKAFDSVPHQKLLMVLENHLVDNKVLKWIYSYLSDRSQQTVVDHCFSDPCLVSSGVPQGSVLGPLLFLLYIDDLLFLLNTIDTVKVYAFADDIKILSDNPVYLQNALDLVEHWSKCWQLRIQPTKSELLSFSPPLKHPSNSGPPAFFINKDPIKPTEVVKDLGIYLSRDLSWSAQVSHVYSKALSLVHTILRSFKTRDHKLFINLYKIYIRPIIEYNSSIWMPHKISDIEKLESIQIKFTRILCKKLNIGYTSYTNRLQILNLETLELRRIKLDLILFYKIKHQLIYLDFDDFFINSNIHNNYNLRRHKSYLDKPHLPKSSHKRTLFSHRIINTWNKLPQNVVSSMNLSIFKSNLNRINLILYIPTKLKFS